MCCESLRLTVAPLQGRTAPDACQPLSIVRRAQTRFQARANPLPDVCARPLSFGNSRDGARSTWCDAGTVLTTSDARLQPSLATKHSTALSTHCAACAGIGRLLACFRWFCVATLSRMLRSVSLAQWPGVLAAPPTQWGWMGEVGICMTLENQSVKSRQRGDSNPCGQSPMDF